MFFLCQTLILWIRSFVLVRHVCKIFSSKGVLTPTDHARVITASPLMHGARRSWFVLSLQDPAFFLIKLCHAANKRTAGSAGSAAQSREALSFQTEAINIIQQRLERNDLNELTVSAVASMVCFEVRTLIVSIDYVDAAD